MLISLVFGFIFGLIVGTTEMPWGLNDWPTEEMRGRYNNVIQNCFCFNFLNLFNQEETLVRCGWVFCGL